MGLGAGMIAEQIGVRCAIYRGGTSKGVYFQSKDLPPPGAERDALLKAVMGSEDLLQIDGLGGSRLVTAKLAIVGPSTRADADVDYTYGIVPPGLGRVVFTSNCGNISAAVGPFAIDSAMVPAREPVTAVRIHNTNTGKLLVAQVPVLGGKARVEGPFAIPGVPGAGAEILMDYRHTVGAKSGRGMPTGRSVDRIVLDDGRSFEVSLCDVGNPCVFIEASSLGLSGSELPIEIDANQTALHTMREIRGHAAAMLGFCADWTLAEAESPALPLVVIVAAPADYRDANGHAVAADASDLRARLIFYNRCHESMAGTGSMCTAAAASVDGTLVHRVARRGAEGLLRIGHPLGVMSVSVAPSGSILRPEAPLDFHRLGFSRTARRLMQGTAYVPNPAAVSALKEQP